MTKMFLILAVMASVFWLWYCIRIVQDVAIGEKYMWSLSTISYNYMWIYNYLKIKSLIEKISMNLPFILRFLFVTFLWPKLEFKVSMILPQTACLALSPNQAGLHFPASSALVQVLLSFRLGQMLSIPQKSLQGETIFLPLNNCRFFAINLSIFCTFFYFHDFVYISHFLYQM